MRGLLDVHEEMRLADGVVVLAALFMSFPLGQLTLSDLVLRGWCRYFFIRSETILPNSQNLVPNMQKQMSSR